MLMKEQLKVYYAFLNEYWKCWWMKNPQWPRHFTARIWKVDTILLHSQFGFFCLLYQPIELGWGIMIWISPFFLHDTVVPLERKGMQLTVSGRVLWVTPYVITCNLHNLLMELLLLTTLRLKQLRLRKVKWIVQGCVTHNVGIGTWREKEIFHLCIFGLLGKNKTYLRSEWQGWETPANKVYKWGRGALASHPGHVDSKFLYTNDVYHCTNNLFHQLPRGSLKMPYMCYRVTTRIR